MALPGQQSISRLDKLTPSEQLELIKAQAQERLAVATKRRLIALNQERIDAELAAQDAESIAALEAQLAPAE